MSKHIKLGCIAEDDSDVDAIKVFVRKITNNDRVVFERFVGQGCGKLKRKCHDWADLLKEKGCTRLVILHDLDNNTIKTLEAEINSSLSPCPIKKQIVCIPIQELEAWLLSDPEAIKTSMHLPSTPKIKGLPETIDSPKEHLGRLIARASKNEIIYINTKHNAKICNALAIDKVLRRCPSFIPFHTFIKSHFPCT
ncbi:DUF4276 family protein [Dehalogenimonas sp. THU2]|uniref:DUF4276 family protein n=1 Tax=Dehalogenimonas sp. THU2 TaxID=3151121 RepID=UPI003218A02C